METGDLYDVSRVCCVAFYGIFLDIVFKLV